jgi:hypothetical protein
MKRIDLIRKLEEAGCVFVRPGGKHDWYHNPKTGVSQPIPRHRCHRLSLEPGIVGIFRPILLLPRDQRSDSQLTGLINTAPFARSLRNTPPKLSCRVS